jgi:signal peptidase I
VVLSLILPLVMRMGFVGLLLAVLVGLAAVLGCAIDAGRVAGSRPPWKILVPVLAILVLGTWMLADARLAHFRRSVQAFTIPSRSMEPTLLAGDYVMADNAVYRGRRPSRGDIVVYRHPVDERRTFVSRIIAGPGETIHVRGPDVLVNGRALDEPYIERRRPASGDVCAYAHGCEPTEVRAGHYFVMSDNRDNARDSRHFGVVREEAIIGRVFTVYWSWDSEAHRLRPRRVGKAL